MVLTLALKAGGELYAAAKIDVPLGTCAPQRQNQTSHAFVDSGKDLSTILSMLRRAIPFLWPMRALSAGKALRLPSQSMLRAFLFPRCV
jgi:hypothetical protein